VSDRLRATGKNAEFRRRPLEALSGHFAQALLLCSGAGRVKLGPVSIDGTRIKISADTGRKLGLAGYSETRVGVSRKHGA
jgi:hypothetical protein